MSVRRPCEVCGRDLPITARGHARTCSARCRKALSRREQNDLMDPDVARVRAGHGLDRPVRPGGLLGPLPRRTNPDPTTEETP